jgi:poly(3-hydroxybutyrate) depolymerase
MNVEIPAAGNAIVIYPEGLDVQPGSTGWNLEDGSDDLAFVDALLDKYSGELCLDLNRVLATGHSYGGCMSNTVGCFRGDVFRAIAPVAGCGPFGNAQCVGQIATLQIHSPKDTATPYGGAIETCTRYMRANTCEENPACGCHWVDELESPDDECIQEAQEPYDTQVDMSPTDRDDQPAVARQYIECDEDFPVIFADHWYREDRPGQEERWHNPPPWAPALIWELFSNLPDVAPGS